jgi:hypothetical protein
MQSTEPIGTLLTNFDLSRDNAFIRVEKRKYKQFLSLKANKPARCLLLFQEGEYITFHGGIQVGEFLSLLLL